MSQRRTYRLIPCRAVLGYQSRLRRARLMITLLNEGQWALFSMVLVAIVIALSFHEFGHAWTARFFGDDTAERAGRLTLNPVAHIDPVGLLMVVFVGFGYARPVPIDPRKFTSSYADLLVAAAGPGMNLLLAVVAINGYVLMIQFGWLSITQEDPWIFCKYFTILNLLLMLFNLLPIGALDGHYILPYFLPRSWAQRYRYYNQRYGNLLLLGLIGLSILGVPVVSTLFSLANTMMLWIVVVPVG
ncbi:MAG TPA: site-2 protease family protein [Gammaproteobacteria bacterium]|nr:site-2 protease family protein [Gammaproteobacteria bacterium]